MNQLEKKQSQVRLSTLLVMDEIFRRSHCFRCLLLSQESFDTFLPLIGLSCSPDSLHLPHDGLPPPADARKRLKWTAIQILDKWNSRFSNGYNILSSACLFLSQHRGVSFSSRSVRPPHVAAAQELADQRRKQQLKQRIEKSCQRFQELSQEIDSVLKQAEEAIQLLVPKHQPPPPSQESPLNLYDNDREVSDRMQHSSASATPCMQPEDMQEHAVRKDVEITISITAAGSMIKKTADNQDIIASIRDHYKLLIRIHLPKLRNLMKALSQGVEYCEETLKRAIDLKNDALIMISKMSELGIFSNDSNSGDNVSKKDSQEDDSDSDDDDFVEVPEKEGLQLVIPQHERYLYGLEDGTQPSSSSCESSSQSGGRVRCCRAPLTSGKLCPRRDLLKCPFHGAIVDRDCMGVPVKEEDRVREEKERANRVPEWQDPAFLRDLEAATGVDLTVSRHKRKRKGVRTESEVARMRNPKERIMQRVFAKESRLRVAREMDAADAANHLQYEDNWSYALNT